MAKWTRVTSFTFRQPTINKVCNMLLKEEWRLWIIRLNSAIVWRAMKNWDSLMISLRHVFVKFDLWSFYIICKCYYHTCLPYRLLMQAVNFFYLHKYIFSKDMIQEKLNFLTFPLLKNNAHFCYFLSLFFPYFHALVHVS